MDGETLRVDRTSNDFRGGNQDQTWWYRWKRQVWRPRRVAEWLWSADVYILPRFVEIRNEHVRGAMGRVAVRENLHGKALNWWRGFKQIWSSGLGTNFQCWRADRRYTGMGSTQNCIWWLASDQASFFSHISHVIDPTFCLLDQNRSLRPSLPLFWVVNVAPWTPTTPDQDSVVCVQRVFWLPSYCWQAVRQLVGNADVLILHESVAWILYLRNSYL